MSARHMQSVKQFGRERSNMPGECLSARVQSMAAGAALAVFCFAIGGGAGVAYSYWRIPDDAYAAGACVAVEMVNAHGALDEVTRLRVMRALTSISNPYRDWFPARLATLSEICAAVREHRYPGALGSL